MTFAESYAICKDIKDYCAIYFEGPTETYYYQRRVKQLSPGGLTLVCYVYPGNYFYKIIICTVLSVGLNRLSIYQSIHREKY